MSTSIKQTLNPRFNANTTSNAFFIDILQKGDGSLLELKSLFPRHVRHVAGSPNIKREFECRAEQCNVNEASQAHLLNVVSLASGPDGSVFIGDFNLVRRVSPKGEVFTVLQFEDSLRDFDYDLCVSPKDGSLYLSHAKKHQVWKLKSLERKEIRNPSANWEIAVGTGDRCVPGDECGDNGPALKAKLNYPKGLAIGKIFPPFSLFARVFKSDFPC